MQKHQRQTHRLLLLYRRVGRAPIPPLIVDVEPERTGSGIRRTPADALVHAIRAVDKFGPRR
jgi:hypothetical protein